MARVAGVSTGTVSRVLNKHPDVSPRAQQRITEAMIELQYRPLPSARALNKQRIGAIGVLLPDMTHHVFMTEAQAIESVASGRGFAVMISDSERRTTKELEFADLMAQYAVSGIVIIGAGTQSDRDIAKRVAAIPVVVVGRPSSGGVFPSVRIDQCDAAKKAVLHLLEHGHRRIAVVRGNPTSVAGPERERGYREALKEAGIELRPELIVGGSFEVEPGIAAIEDLMRLPNAPSAIVFPNDEVAIAGIRALRNHGLRVPEDVSIVGFDDIPFAQFSFPPLTTIHTPARELAMLGTQMLIDLMEGRGAARDVVLGAELIVRESTSPPRS